jgi:hypothetical protein
MFKGLARRIEKKIGEKIETVAVDKKRKSSEPFANLNESDLSRRTKEREINRYRERVKKIFNKTGGEGARVRRKKEIDR